ncbi:MAG: threonine synthase [Acidobacteria bacterium]|nr:threonine synthase [Acidobacteriota bacterium]
MTSLAASTLSRLECGNCGRVHEALKLQGLCGRCDRPLLARYDLGQAAATLKLPEMAGRRPDMWRYGEVLPLAGEPVSLGEGWTPLIRAPRLGADLGVDDLLIKDESLNPTGSFKARGLSAAINMARERGVTRVVMPTAGNAGVATAAYAAAANLAAEIFCPADTPVAFVHAIKLLGARVHLVDGLIDQCGAAARKAAATGDAFDLSTLKEPYRLEGKKTMGYELVEQMGGRLPDVIFYPTGGGTGLIGMWKAFQEMEEMGWIGAERPRMVSVQAAGCAPMVRAFAAGATRAEPWENASTLAAGLRVPGAVGDMLILSCLRASGGTAVAVTDEEMLAGVRLLGRLAGVLAAPEGGATVAAARRLRREGFLAPDHTVVLFNTGTALSYMDVLAGAAR